MDKRFTWIVRFDVAPEWVADGFTMTDDIAFSMIEDRLSFARGDEMTARVIAAPSAMDIANEQGYKVNTPGAHALIDEVRKGAPLAYRHGPALADKATLESTLLEAIKLLDSVAFVRDENDNTGATLSKLRDALALVRGTDPIEGSDEVGDESHHSHINGGDL